MTYNDIVNYVTSKIGESDTDTQARVLAFAKARHRLIYESFDWTAAQNTVTVQVTVGAGQGGGVRIGDPSVPSLNTPLPTIPPPQPPLPPQPPVPPPVPPPPPGQGGGSNDIPVSCERVISCRFNGTYLDPVTPNYIFESHPEMFIDSGTPQFFWSRYLPDQQTTAVRLFPGPNVNGTIELLVKNLFNDSQGTILIPNIEDTILCFVLADMWENLRQMGIYAQKLQEAQGLLKAAQDRDVPSTPKPRMSKSLTADGQTLGEMTDSVCDIIGRWEPDVRESVRDRIRRNHRQIHDSLMLPETLLIASVPIEMSQEQIILPPYFDRVIEVRLNFSGSTPDSIFGPISTALKLSQHEISYFFNVDYAIFERVGPANNYSILPSVGVTTLPPFLEKIRVFSDSNSQGSDLTTPPHIGNPDAGSKVFIRGMSGGAEVSEALLLTPGPPTYPGTSSFRPDIWNTMATTQFAYDTPFTVSKPDTIGTVSFWGATSQTKLLALMPKEHERKCIRIWLLPNLDPQGVSSATTLPGSALVLGKRRAAQLIDDLDSPQIRNISNILIHAAAADMLDRLGKADESAKYQQKATNQLQGLVESETKQSAYQPVITPYVSSWDSELSWWDSEMGW